MIKTENLTYSYNSGEDGEKINNVFENLNLSIKKGSFTTVLGHNGSGKSTLAKHFNAILLPTGGKVYVGGMDTADEGLIFEIRKNSGMVFQNPDNQIVTAIVEDEVAFAPENLGVEPSEIRKRVDKALEIVDMSEYAELSTAGLSGGQKQKIAIASILAMQPECIILDEPTAMLDPKGRRDVIDTIKYLNKTSGMTVVLITHYMDEVVDADRIIVMNKGKIVMDDIPKRVFSRSEELKKCGLDVPKVTELTHLLINAGMDLSDDITDVDECAEKLYEILSVKGTKGEDMPE